MAGGDSPGERILRGYEDSANELIARYEAISSAREYAPLAHLLPARAGRVLDLGAGTGRDAAWFAGMGHSVLAVEPVRRFRAAGARLHPTAGIEWVDDTLPALRSVTSRGLRFDLVNVNGVWQHLDAGQRHTAMPVLRALVAPEGRLVVSVRHGPGAPSRPCFQAPAQDTIDCAVDNGFALDYAEERESIHPANRAAGVTWTWLVFSPAI